MLILLLAQLARDYIEDAVSLARPDRVGAAGRPPGQLRRQRQPLRARAAPADYIEHVEQVVDTAEPLKARVRALAHSQPVGVLQQRAWALLFERIKTGQKVTVEALGGSMVTGFGTGCGAECSYSALFASKLVKGQLLDYVNRAQGGMTTGGVLPMLPSLSTVHGKAPDLLIIDYSINDLHSEQDWRSSPFGADHSEQPLDNLTTSTQNHSGTVTGQFSVFQKVFAATEQLLCFLLEERPTTSILLVETPLCASNQASKRAHKIASGRYGVSFMEFGQLVLPTCSDRAELSAHAWGNQPLTALHPPVAAHRVIAEALGRWLELLEERAETEYWESRLLGVPLEHLVALMPGLIPQPVAPLALRQAYQICKTPLSVFDAHGRDAAGGFKPQIVSGDWQLTEDRPGKPGWVSTTAGSILEFNLSFGLSPRVAIVYTRGYDRFGDVEMWLEPHENRATLIKGCCNLNKVTQDEVLVASVQRNVHNPGYVQGNDPVYVEAMSLLYGVLPHSARVLRVRARPDGSRHAFKIVSVVSC
tara:strand:+ start:2451 stop:4046 length:1596 start_codon:yes stop_codon:yes gene_type:complete